jgi:Xaa-Pro dipeptidase
MRNTKAGMYEFQLEKLFQFHSGYFGGCRLQGYTSICACGPNSSVLHYGHAGAPNDYKLKEDDMALLDMGSEFHCYNSDITCSFPVRGSFSDDQKVIYEAVLNAQRDVYAAMKPGASWVAIHQIAERAILSRLKEGGLVVGDIDDMMQDHLGATFMPHGLGHLIGLDVHDVGGYLQGQPTRIDAPGLRKLRTARALEENMVITVEPGCYFINVLLDEALAHPVLSKYLVPDAIQRYRNTGGVRLEDDVLVTVDGCENLTHCPRTVEEVESVLSGDQWPPPSDTAPWLFRKTMIPEYVIRLTFFFEIMKCQSAAPPLPPPPHHIHPSRTTRTNAHSILALSAFKTVSREKEQTG